MALCLAESLLECDGFDAVDQLTRYVGWMRDGHHSSNGRCFDVGITVRSALGRFERTREPSGSADERSAGNGSLMRLAPVPLFFAADPALAIAEAAASSRTTHAHPEAVDACRYFAGLLLGALSGMPKDRLLEPAFSPSPDEWKKEPLNPAIARVADGSFLRSEPPAIRGSGYVTHSLEAALWAFAKSTSFQDGALLAVNLGEDADTTGAIYGQLAGAFYGVDSIPERWRSKLAKRDLLEDFADRLFKAAEARR
jgi:ADP-ribosylglycohydrolase